MPRTIYGEIVSSADRSTDIVSAFTRTHKYSLKHYPEFTIDEHIKRSYEHLEEKFGVHGYAINKIHFKDLEYENFLKTLQEYLKHYNKFKEMYFLYNKI